MSKPGPIVPNRLRVAVAACDAMARGRLSSLVLQSGHELVASPACSDAVLTDGATDGLATRSAVAVGALNGDFAGLLPQDATAAQVDAALRAAAAGLTVRASNGPSRHFGPLPEESAPLLTPREIEVLAALSNGLSNKAAARQLGISPYTVKFHIESLFRKLGAASRAEAVARGIRQQIVEF